MDNISQISSPNSGSFVDYSVIQTLADNDRIINKKITHVGLRDKTTGKNVIYNENDGVKVASGRITDWVVKGKGSSSQSKDIKIASLVPPNVQLTVYGSTYVNVTTSSVSTSGFTVNAFNTSEVNRTVTVMWIAITLVGTKFKSEDISSVGSVSDGMFSDFNVLAKLYQNDSILNRKILQHYFLDYTGSISTRTQEDSQMRFRCGWVTIKDIPPAGTSTGDSKDKAVTFTPGIAPPSVHVTGNNGSVRLATTKPGLGGFTISARNTGKTKRTVDVFWMALVVDSE